MAETPTPPATPGAATGWSPTASFRPDIEGLRALAVLSVLAYHAGVPGLRGGYVGVDVFFVISGFLITGLIVGELDRTGTVSLLAFYARRARRLLPAAAAALGATVLVSAVVLPPLRVPDVAGDGIAAALYAANMRFALQAMDYLQAELAPSPLLHYWSLGVEEQFYLFWPALLLLVARGRPRPLLPIAATVGIVGLGSLALGIALTGIAAPWAFYSLPSRAWELALGAGVLLGSRVVKPGPRLALVAGCAGIALVCLSFVILDTSTPFPGTAALIPTTGTALVLAAGLAAKPSVINRFLALSPLRFIGRISYSLYLWHWPMLVLPAAALGTTLTLQVRLALALLVIPIGAASQRWIEEPVRRGGLAAARPRRTLAMAGLISLMGVAISFGSRSIGFARLAGSVPQNLLPPLEDARDDLPRIYGDGCHLGFRDARSGPCTYGDSASGTTVVLFGDSHAAQWFPTLERLALQRHWRLVSFTKGACSAADVPGWNSDLNRAYTECEAWRADVLARIAADRPRLVVLSHSRRHVITVGDQHVPSEQREDIWEAALERTIRRITPLAGAVAIIGDTPRLVEDGPVCLSIHPRDALACATPLAAATNPARTAGERKIAEVTGATFIDPAPWLCPFQLCPAVMGRVIVFRDSHHMTATYARALAPQLGMRLPLAPGQ